MRFFTALALPTLFLAIAVARAADSYPSPADLPSDGDRSRAVAEITGKPVSFGELLDSAHESLEHQKAVYELRRRQLDEDYRRAQQQTLEGELNRMLNERVTATEAHARGITTFKLIGEVKTPPVTDQEVKALYEQRKIDGAEPFEKIAPQLRDGLAQQKSETAVNDYLMQLRVKYKVTPLLQPLRTQVAAEGPSRGPVGAPVTIVEFADFQCPFCRRLEPSLEHLLARYPTQVRLVYRHYPLTEIHPEALHAAQASVCAERQGKFWEMHDAIFADQAPLSLSSLRALAAKVQLDSDKFEQCVRDPDMNKVISDDVHAGDDLSVHSTPTLFVNGRYVEGGVPEEKLVELVEDELKRTPMQAAR